MKTRFASIILLAAIVSFVTSCGLIATENVKKRQKERIPSIGLAFALGDRNDASINRSVYKGLLLMLQDYKGHVEGSSELSYGAEFVVKILDTDTGQESRAELLSTLARQGHDFVVAVGYLFSDSIRAVAREFPYIKFILLDGSIPDIDSHTNIQCISFAEQEGSFIVGAYAGLYTLARGDNARIAFIGAMDAPNIRRYYSGFAAGAAYTNPAFRVSGSLLSGYISRDSSGFYDKKGAAEFASVFYNEGRAVVIYQAAGSASLGIAEAAQRLGTRLIGSDIDLGSYLLETSENSEADSVVLASMIKRADRAIYSLANVFLQKEPFVGGYKLYNLAEGGVGYISNKLEEKEMLILADISRKISESSIVVPHDEEALQKFIATLPKQN